MELPRFLPVMDAAKRTGIPEATLRRWLRRDDPPPSVRDGRQAFLEVEGLAKYIKEEERRCKLQRR